MNNNTKPTEYKAKVAWVKKLAGDFYHIRFNLISPDTISFLAGQYVIFRLGPPKGNHTMSLVSLPSDSHAIEILQSVAPMGQGSQWVLSLKRGDPVSFLGPVGKFVMPTDSGRQKVFVSTGCGIAPLRSMILDELKGQGTINNKQMTLYWGLRFETDLFWQDEFEKLAKEHPHFQYYVTLSKPTEHWQGMKGRVTDHVITKTKNLLESEFYLCGNREMIVEMRKQLTDAGVAGDQIFTEAFF